MRPSRCSRPQAAISAPRFPNGTFSITPGRGTQFQQVGGDELLFTDAAIAPAAVPLHRHGRRHIRWPPHSRPVDRRRDAGPFGSGIRRAARPCVALALAATTEPSRRACRASSISFRGTRTTLSFTTSRRAGSSSSRGGGWGTRRGAGARWNCCSARWVAPSRFATCC